MAETVEKWKCVAAEFGEGENKGLVAFWIRMQEPCISFAHADLIAAAPKLLEAAIEAREALLGGYATREGKELLAQDVEDALVLLTTAISEATGSAQKGEQHGVD